MNDKEYEVLRLKYDRFIRVTAIRLDIDNTMFQDLYQIGLIALYEAQTKYNEDKGTLHTFIMRFITYEMMDYLTIHSKTIRIPTSKLREAKQNDKFQLKKAISINTPLGEDGTIEDLIGSEDEDTSMSDQDIQIRARLRVEMDNLKPEYQKVIWMYSVLDMTFQEIANEMNMTKENVRQKYVKGIKILRDKI